MAHISTVIHVLGTQNFIEVEETSAEVMKAVTKQNILEQQTSALPKGFITLTSSVTKKAIIVNVTNIVSIQSREG